MCEILFRDTEMNKKSAFAMCVIDMERDKLQYHFRSALIMASSPITSWQIDGETMETVTDSIFLGSKFTVDCDCSHEIKRHFLLERKAMTNLDSVLKSRDILIFGKTNTIM